MSSDLSREPLEELDLWVYCIWRKQTTLKWLLNVVVSETIWSNQTQMTFICRTRTFHTLHLAKKQPACVLLLGFWKQHLYFHSVLFVLLLRWSVRVLLLQSQMRNMRCGQRFRGLEPEYKLLHVEAEARRDSGHMFN